MDANAVLSRLIELGKLIADIKREYDARRDLYTSLSEAYRGDSGEEEVRQIRQQVEALHAEMERLKQARDAAVETLEASSEAIEAFLSATEDRRYEMYSELDSTLSDADFDDLETDLEILIEEIDDWLSEQAEEVE